MVEDISGGTINSTVPVLNGLAERNTGPEIPTSPTRISQRKITMPAGFPHSTYGSSTSDSTSHRFDAPYTQRSLNHNDTRSNSYTNDAVRRDILSERDSGKYSSKTSSMDGRNNPNDFRFRGQFSSQPPTPGPGLTHSVYSESESRAIGALNSRVR